MRANLTPREQEILEYVIRGFSNREIAQQLGISWRTVDTHLRNIYRKMGVKSRAQAAALYVQGKEEDG